MNPIKRIIAGMACVFTFISIGGFTIALEINNKSIRIAEKLAKKKVDAEILSAKKKSEEDNNKPINAEKAATIARPTRKSWLQGINEDGVPVYERSVNLREIEDYIYLAQSCYELQEIDGRILAHDDDKYHRVTMDMLNKPYYGKDPNTKVFIELKRGKLYVHFDGVTQDENCWINFKWACPFPSGRMPDRIEK